MTNRWDEARIQQLIDDEIEESVTLDYKASAALGKTDGKKKEISKDVTAMANSAGGTIIYGVSEHQQANKQHLPKSIDPIDRTKFSKEWLEHVINSNTHPRIEGLVIHPVGLASGSTDAVYVVEIPQSTVPHQARDFRYYKRYNFESLPMLDYEVNDVRNRRSTIQTLVIVEVTLKHSSVVFLTVRNVGTVEARNVNFRFNPEPVWHQDKKPPLFDRGARMIPAGREISFFYGPYIEILNSDESPTRFDVEVSYDHPEAQNRITDYYHIDLIDYKQSATLRSDLQEHAETLKKSLGEVKRQLESLNKHLSGVTSVTAPTGLDLSVTTLRNLRLIAKGDDELVPIDPYYCDRKVFSEVLGVDFQMADRLYRYFDRSREDAPDEDLDSLPGMTDGILKKFHRFFEL
jgi:hypothetical protein